MPKRKNHLPQCIPHKGSALALGKKCAYATVSQWKKPDCLKLQQLLVITEKPSPSLQRLLQNLVDDDHVSTAIFEPTCSDTGCDVSLLDTHFQRYAPDVVLVDLDGCPKTLDTPESLGALCQRVRQLGLLSNGYRAVLLVLDCPEDGPSSEKQRLQALSGGADDLLTGHLSMDELSTRLGAHLRRHLDNQYHPISCLPNLLALNRQVCRTIGIHADLASPMTLLSVHLEGYAVYKAHYGEALAEKLLEQFSLLFAQIIPPQDRVFHHQEASFMVLTATQRSERLAQVLATRLPALLKKAYTAVDWDLGFHPDGVMGSGSFLPVSTATGVFRKIPLLRVGLGIFPLNAGKIEHLMLTGNTLSPEVNALQQATQLAMYASLQAKQSVVILTESQRLTSSQHLQLLEEEALLKHQKPMVVVFEPDAALAFLLQTTLSFQGYDVVCVSSVEEAVSISNQVKIALWLLDFSGTTPTPWQHQLARIRWATGCPVLMTSHFITAQEALQAGTDSFIGKPFNLAPLLAEVAYWLSDSANPR
jgi:DNA-binding response OmpR family regulator